MLRYHRCLLSILIGAAVSLTAAAQALSFDDVEFCVAARQLAIAVNKDVDVWLDRTTRNDGVAVSCDRRLVEFKRFVSARGAAIDSSWNERKTNEWNATHCENPIWAEAIRNGWTIAAAFAASDGTRVSIRAQCN